MADLAGARKRTPGGVGLRPKEFMKRPVVGLHAARLGGATARSAEI
jgi:hypothetical protein